MWIYFYVGENMIEVWVTHPLGALACIHIHKLRQPDRHTNAVRETFGPISTHGPGSRRATRMHLRSNIKAMIHSRIHMYSMPLDGDVHVRMWTALDPVPLCKLALTVGRRKNHLVAVEAVGYMACMRIRTRHEGVKLL